MPPQSNSEYFDRVEKAVDFWNINSNSYTLKYTAQKFKVAYETLRQRVKNPTRTTRQQANGGQNKALSTYQTEAICNYIRDQASRGFGASKSMILAAATELRAKQNQPPPSTRWLQRFLKQHPEFHTIRTKPLNSQRKTAQNKEVFEAWFWSYRQEIERLGLELTPENIWNFDESGFQIGCLKATEVVVPVEILQVCIILLLLLILS